MTTALRGLTSTVIDALRARNLQALHGHGHDAQTREHREYLPRGKRDKHQDPEERRDAKGSCAVLEQREAERSAYRL